MSEVLRSPPHVELLKPFHEITLPSVEPSIGGAFTRDWASVAPNVSRFSFPVSRV